jgi:hypothetical protein
MENLFFSKDNFNLLNQIINIKIKELHDIELDQSFNKIILNGMKYVFNNINSRCPRDMQPNKYLDMINIKCLSVILPRIEEQIKNKRDLTKSTNIPPINSNISQRPISSNEYNNYNDYNDQKYQPELLKPPQISSYNDNINEKYENLQNVRNQEYGLIKNQEQQYKEISDKKEERPSLEKSEIEYNKRLQERNISIPLTSKNNNSLENLEKYFPDINTINLNSSDELKEEFVRKHNRGKNQQVYRDSNEELKNEDNNKIENDIEKLNKIQKNYHPNIIKLNEEETNKIMEFPTFNPKTLGSRNPVIFPEKPKYIKKIHYVTIDSRDRDLELYPSASFFQVKFSPATDSILTKTICVTSDMRTVLYGFKEDISGERGASIPRTFENIYSIQCTQAIVPLESTYVCGIAPNRFYDNRIDTICAPGATGASGNDNVIKNFGKYSGRVIPIQQHTNNPIWNNNIGIQTTVLDIPYLLLTIKELESYSPYYGTNTPNRRAFAKLVYDTNFGVLSPFIKMLTSETDEYYKFEPTPLSRLDKFTLALDTPEGNPFFFGLDKIYIQTIKESPNFLKGCPSGTYPNGQKYGIPATRIFIDTKRTFGDQSIICDCNTFLKSAAVKPGDLIFIYSTVPGNPTWIIFQDVDKLITYNKFRIIINEENTFTYNLSINIIIDELNDIEEPIDFSKFMQVDGYFLVLNIDNNNPVYNVINIDSTNITVKKVIQNDIEILKIYDNTIITRIGFSKQNNKGILQDIQGAINNDGGVRVCSVGDSTLCTPDEKVCEDCTISQTGNFLCDPGNPYCCDYDPNNAGSESNFFSLINPDGILPDPTDTLYFDIDFPASNIPIFIRDINFQNGEVFFIKQKLQISYTFKIITLEKDYKNLESFLVGP